MSKTSCIQHPSHARIIHILQWQLDICNDDGCAAALLSHFEYWHNIKLESLERSKTQESAKNLLQWYTARDLEKALMMYNKKRIPTALNLLESLGFISIHRNPNPRYGFDNTKYFLFYPDKVNAKIKEWENQQENIIDDASDFGNLELSNLQDDLADITTIVFPKIVDEIPEIGETVSPEVARPDPEIYHNDIQELLQELPLRTTHKNYSQEFSREFAKSAFETFWQTWTSITQKSVKQEASRKIFENFVKSNQDPLLEIILQALQNQGLEKQLRSQIGVFTPNWPDPDNWLREMRWQDAAKTDIEALKADFVRQAIGNSKLQQELVKNQREKILDEEYQQRLGNNAEPGNSRQRAISKIEAEFQRTCSGAKKWN